MNQEDTIRISLIGDIFPGELAYTQNYGIRSQFLKHKGKPWIDKVKGIIGENDIVIGNLESPLVPAGDAIKKTFFGEPKYAKFLKDCGINVINIANNHIMEHGTDGFNSTIAALNDAGINATGCIVNSKPQIIYKNIKRYKIAIAGFSNVDLHLLQNNDQFSILNEENVLSTLNTMMEQKADLKILCFHWGNEYIHIPSLVQRDLAYKFIDNGADMIVGHHPHVIQPYEAYKNGHVFYSLGNFIFDYVFSEMVSIGLIATLSVTRHDRIRVDLKGVKLSYEHTLIPLPSQKFEKYYSSITKLYKEFSMLSHLEYTNRYNSLQKKNNLRQRVLMKTSIVNELLSINKKDKIFLIKNLGKHYINLIKTFTNKTFFANNY